ncbi:MAG: deoxyribodipyrimidine photo-lyase [Chloroflexota bacterium]|nr:MAG: deoxyribodipyrimidine photo-lyase [Chloroflexota bacterium]
MGSIWWIRRDLRLRDNLTLQKALETPPVLPVFILDPLLLKNAPERRLNFLFQNLHSLNKDLQSRGSNLVVRTGKPAEILESLLKETSADQILAEEDFTPYARMRSVLAGSFLPLKLVQGQLGTHPLESLKSSGKPYRVFGPFKKNWLAHIQSFESIPAPALVPTLQDIDSDGIPMGGADDLFPAGEEAAYKRLEIFLRKKVEFYHLTRDRMDLDGSSNLSPYFRFGVIGLRSAIFRSLEILKDENGRKNLLGIDAWLNDLIWREYHIHIMYHFPESRTQNFRSVYDGLLWINDQSDFQAWKVGRTGYPVVDAAMRQLNTIGWIPRQSRNIAASFLVKGLLIDWRWGEKWFRDRLLDGDLAVNVGNWQRAAGTGPDAAPFDRILNPTRQSKKYDPTGNYIRKWVPELAELDKDVIHGPWQKRAKAAGYPKPIIDHKFATERAVAAYQAAKDLIKL